MVQEGEEQPPSLKSCSNNNYTGDTAQFFFLTSDSPNQRHNHSTGVSGDRDTQNKTVAY